jgi:hypothetical protein
LIQIVASVWITAYRARGPEGLIRVGTGGRSGADYEFLSRLKPYQPEILESLPEGSEYKLTYKADGYSYGGTRGAAEFESEAEQRKWLAETLNSYVNVFRPLAEKMIREDETDKSNL